MGKFQQHLSPEERILADKELAQQVVDMWKRIILDPGKRTVVILDILREIEQLKEPDRSDRMEILRLSVKKGYLQDELREAVSRFQDRQRGQPR